MMSIARQLAALAPSLSAVSPALGRAQQQWWALLHALRGMSGELDAAQLAELLAALAPALDAWPALARQVPREWSGPELLTQEAALVGLCRARVLGPAILDAADLAAQLGSPALAHITHLMLHGVPLDVAAVEALGDARPASVTALRLEACRLNARAVVAMCAHPRLLAGLSALDLRDNQIPRQGAEALAGCVHLSALDTLILRKNPIGDAGRIALGRSAHLSDAAKRSARAVAAAPLDAAPAPVEVGEVFGDLRSVLQQAPSAQGWARVCDMVARIEAERATHETLPYVEAGLSAWTAVQRPLMAAWQEQIAAGEPVPPAARLARSMELGGGALNEERARRLGSWAAEAGVARIALSGAPPSHSALVALLREPGAGPLRALHHGCDTIGRALELCAGVSAPLSALSFGVVRDGARPVRPLLHGEATASLRAFGVEGFEEDAARWSALRSAGWWWGLGSLRLGAAMSSRARRDDIAASLLGASTDPAWSALEVLSLRGLAASELLEGGAEALAARLPALRSLRLDQAPEDSAFWPLLERLPGSLEELELGLVSRALPVLERARHIASPALRRLALVFARGFDIPDSAGPARLLGAPWVSGLEELELGCFARDDVWTARALEALPVGLGSLALSQCVLGPRAGETLAGRPFEALRSLRISGAQLGEEALRALMGAGWWSGLTALSLHMDYGPRHAAPLAALAGRLPPGLRTLQITCSVEAPVVTLLEGGLPSGLTSLSLQQGAVASAGFKAVVELLGSLPALHTLELDGDHITRRALPSLLESPHLARIPLITMRSSQLGFSGKQMILGSPAAPISLKSAL